MPDVSSDDIHWIVLHKGSDNPSPGDLFDEDEDAAYLAVLAAVRTFSSRNFSTLDFELTPSEALGAWIASA